MSSGLVHTRANTVIALGVLIFVRPIETAILMASGCVLAIFVGPDNDLNGSNYSFYLVKKYLGKVPHALWRAFWWPFQRVTPHRHFISHFPVVGTFLRFLYLFCPLLLVILAIFPDFSSVFWIIPVFWGAVIVDTTHWAMDHISTSLKKHSSRINLHRVK